MEDDGVGVAPGVALPDELLLVDTSSQPLELELDVGTSVSSQPQMENIKSPVNSNAKIKNFPFRKCLFIESSFLITIDNKMAATPDGRSTPLKLIIFRFREVKVKWLINSLLGIKI